MISSYSPKRVSKLGAFFGAALLASSCASQPSLGPKTATGLPSHVDGGAGQVLRFCEKLHDKGDLATAAAMCERAHRLDPSRPEPLLELASILGEMGKTELSLQAYRTILETTPDNGPAHYGLGRSYLDQGKFDLALTEFRAALEADPRNPRLYSAAGIASGLLGNHAEAQDAFRKGLQFAPDDRALRNNLALSLVQTGNYGQGLNLLSALANEPGADRASRDNLEMAQGLAAAARTEQMLAEARAKAEAEAKARAEAEAKAKAEAEGENRAAAETADATGSDAKTARPAIIVSYPRESWPMDGPGTDGMVPVESPEKQMAEQAAPEKEMDTEMDTEPRLTPERLAQSGKPLRPIPRPMTGPTSLTNSMSTPPNMPGATIGAPAPEARPKPQPMAEQTAQLGAEPTARQTARADLGGTSDAETSMDRSGEAIVRPLTNKPKETPGQAGAAASSAGYAVQFASYTSEERAWRGWDTLQVEATDLLSDVTPSVQRADLGGASGIVYRLRTVPTERAQAETLCGALKARGVDCLVVKSDATVAKTGEAGQKTTL